MTCKTCGAQLAENETICGKCGTPVSAEANISDETAEVIPDAPRGFSNAKKLLLIVLISVVLIVGGIISGYALSSAANSPSRLLASAQKYLSEADYEQAIIEFDKILKIDPLNADAYLGKAEALIGLNRPDEAKAVLEEGYQKTDDPRLKSLLDELTKPQSSSGTSVPEPPASGGTPAASSQPGTSNTLPAYGSMGSVTIAGTELDIATTTKLLIFNKARYESPLTGKWYSSSLLDDPERYNYRVVYLSGDLSESDMEKAQQLSQLEELRINYAGLTDITSLAGLSNNLYFLELRSNQISDVTPLANLTNLTRLKVDENQISDISPLANLTNLTELDLDGNQISDISPLANLTNLTDLHLDSNQSSDISPLANLTKLTYLYLGGNQISDITPLANFTDLTVLNLSANQISDISPLANLTDLEEVRLPYNQISDTTPLANLTNLTYLSLWDNQISNISPLANLTNLTSLGLGINQISDITPLANLTKLTKLELGVNQISEADIETLKSQLPNCEVKH